MLVVRLLQSANEPIAKTPATIDTGSKREIMNIVQAVLRRCLRSRSPLTPEPRQQVQYDGGNITMSGARLVSALGLDEAVPVLEKAIGGDTSNIIGMALNVLNHRPTTTFLDVYQELANTFLSTGHAEAALPFMKRYLDADPTVGAHQAYLNCLLLSPDATNQDLFEAATNYSEIYAPFKPVEPDFSHIEFDAGRRLRIGYVCEFFDSSVMRSGQLELIRLLDRDAFETYCYSDGPIPESHRACADHWRDTAELGAVEMFHRIRSDRIDVLVDLSGPTTGNRFETYAHRPAPLQMSGPNYAATSGLPFFDFTLAAADIILPEEEKFFTETITRDPRFFGFAAPSQPSNEIQVPVAEPPALRNGSITFGYFGSTHKLNRACIENWSLILRQISSSRLILKAGGFEHALVRQSIATMFAHNGIPEARIDFRGHSPYVDMQAEYADIDIAFDGYPSTGGATLNDLLWQGVPCVSLEGDRNLARNGPARLRRVGMGHLVGKTPDECVRIAVELAADVNLLTEMRRTQRVRLSKSMLFDREGYASAFENALRKLWRQACNQNWS